MFIWVSFWASIEMRKTTSSIGYFKGCYMCVFAYSA